MYRVHLISQAVTGINNNSQKYFVINESLIIVCVLYRI